MRNPSVSVCFPAYNEKATIKDVLLEAYDLMKKSGLDYEILACNDGSTDDTPSILNELEQRIPTLKVFHNNPNQGMRYTFELLYHKATKDYVFLNSSDRQWPTQCLFDMLPLTEHYDIIVASRKNKNYSLYRAILSRAYNTLPQWLFNVKTYDAGAVKLIKREIIEKFPLISLSPFTEAERIIRAARSGYKITEFPVETAPRLTGKATGAKLGLVFQAVIDVIKVWWDLKGARSTS